MKGSSVIGRVIPLPKGDWNINKFYKKLDIVYTDGKSYIAKQDVPPTTSITTSEYWQILAEGTLGLTGNTGPTGDTGPTGGVYYPSFDVDLDTGILYVVQYDNGPQFEIDNGDLYITLGN